MEKEGLVRSLNYLHSKGLDINNIVTDRHVQVQKYLRETYPSIAHYYDVWHVAKGVTKKLEALANQRGCNDVREWIHSISNHMYWAAGSSTTGDEIVAKWTSVANHVQNIHQHDDWHFPSCLHEPVADVNQRKWLKPSTKSCETLVSIITNRRLLKDIAKLSTGQQTSSIEAFHSLIIQFAPKMYIYSYMGMLCRLLLAAIHYNENADRTQAADKDGQLKYSVRFPKAKKGDYTVLPVMNKPTFVYIDKLLNQLFTSVLQDSESYQQLQRDVTIPPPLCAGLIRPAASDIVNIVSRYTAKREV